MKIIIFISTVICIGAILAYNPITSSSAESGCELGDVNCDGTIDASDASLVLQAYSTLSTGGTTDINIELADFNDDNIVDASDASLILRKYAELSTSKPITYFSECVSADIKSDKNISVVSLDNEYALSQTDFALSLLKSQSANKNICISPFSIMQAITMTANGAAGSTKDEMENVLGMDIEKLNNYLYSHRSEISNDNVFKSANSIWLKNTELIEVEKDFLQNNVNYYNADIFRTTFDKTTIDDLNNWCAYKTDEAIPKIIEDISYTSLLYLVNATTFNADWESKVLDCNVGIYDFNSADGSIQKIEMMNSDEAYYICDKNSVGVYKYYEGRKYAFAAILPDENITLDEYISALSAEQLREMISAPQNCVVKTRIPKFKYECDSILNKTLENMGMKTAFQTNADFSKIGKTQNGNLFINSIQHKTFIDVNQEGTKVSSATSVEMGSTALPVGPDEMKNVVFDRPFLFCIIDTEINTPIFMGNFVGEK